MTLTRNTQRAHDAAAENLANSYLKDLARASDRTPFGLLEARAENWRHSLASEVYETAALYRVYNIKYRHEVVVAGARWLIKQHLKTNDTLRDKLVEIRRHEEQAERAAAMAEQASWPALSF
jgi:hypothetical protein